MQRWINGDWESVWNEAYELEIIRKQRTKRRMSRKKRFERPEETKMKKWTRVKRLVNDGELSKAARDINGAGVAEP